MARRPALDYTGGICEMVVCPAFSFEALLFALDMEIWSYNIIFNKHRRFTASLQAEGISRSGPLTFRLRPGQVGQASGKPVEPTARRLV